jgi:hypothetical protein
MASQASAEATGTADDARRTACRSASTAACSGGSGGQTIVDEDDVPMPNIERRLPAR